MRRRRANASPSAAAADAVSAAARLAAILDASPDAIFSVTLDGIITSWNRAAESMFGWSAAEAIGQPVSLIDPDDVLLGRVRNGETVEQLETMRRSRSGRLVDVSLTVSPVRTVRGRITGVSMIARDITDRRRLAEAQARLAAIVESSDDVIVSKNLDGIITSWNAAAERMFGWTATEAVGRHIALIIPEDRFAEEDTVIARIRRGERVEHFDTIRRTKDGRLIDMSITVSPVRDSTGRIVGASKIGRDITERRRMDEERRELLVRELTARETAEAANRAKDEFLAVVSHELRTPLNAVFGWARMLQSAEMNDATRERALAAIVRGAAAQVHLIEDLLDVSRIVTGKLRVELQRVDVCDVAAGALETVRPAAAAKSLAIETQMSPTPVIVLGADDRLQQVLWNLLMNAVKFTPRHGRVLLRVQERDGDAEITVSDTGEGIAAGMLPHVFEQFTQEDSSTTRAHEGLGLGLALVRHIVDLHGGSVTAESAGKNEGATFRVLLPLAPPAPSGEA
jgi:PAS domain S-box-containing protein